jgi:hypothetical protein
MTTLETSAKTQAIIKKAYQVSSQKQGVEEKGKSE